MYGCRGSHGDHRGRRTTSVSTQEVSYSRTPSSRKYQTELFRIGLGAKAGIDIATAQQENLFERRPKLAVEPGVDDGIEKTVGVTQPEEESFQPVWNAFRRLLAERLYEGQYEERQPAGGDGEKTQPSVSLLQTNSS